MLRTHEASGSASHLPRPLVDGGRVALPSRCRLLERLVEETAGSAGKQRLTLVYAPTGYGKTATIADWLGDDSDGPLPVFWVHSSKREPHALWDELAEALASRSDYVAREGADPLSTVMRLARGLHTAVTLVIDDFHHATSAETDMALAELSAESSLLTLIIIGRGVTLLDGPLVSATTRVRLIGVDDLSLTSAEALELTQSLRVPESPNLTTALERTEGWPLAIRAALNLGADGLYSDTAEGRIWADGPAAHSFDPLANLNAFAMASLEIMSVEARRVILAAAQIDFLSVNQIRSIVGADEPTVSETLNYLTEHGFLMEVTSTGAPEYRCHRSVRAPFADYAVSALDVAERKRLYSSRAHEIAGTAPFTAFRLFCAAEEFEAAEITLAQNFTTITDEVDGAMRALRSLSEEVLLEHPTLTAALLFLENPRVGVAPSRLNFLLRVWQLGLQRRLPEGASTPPGPIHLQLLCEAMVLNRVLGNLDDAEAYMHHIEGRLAPDHVPALPIPGGSDTESPAVLTGNGSLSVFYREVAATALSVGDFGRARRNLKRLRRRSERKLSTPWHGFPHASTRTVTDPESGGNWLLAALSELAFTDTIDGHIRRAGELVHEFDEIVASTKAQAPGIAWVGIEIARAHLAEENRDPAKLAVAVERLAPIADRLEPWPLLLIAEAASIRDSRGTELALAHLASGLEDTEGRAPIPKAWCKYVINFEAMLNSSIGNLARSEALLAAVPSEEPVFRLERARLALFSGNDVEALLIAQSVGDPGTTKRQRVDRRMITAVAAWGCGRPTEAINSLASAAALIDKYFLPAMLVSVPFEQLRELAVAARDAGACDIVDALDAIPEKSRAYRYEQLTEMELRTLAAISEHRNANHAAASLFITAGTVKKHLASVYKKLGVRDRDAAILRAGRMGLLDGLPETTA